MSDVKVTTLYPEKTLKKLITFIRTPGKIFVVDYFRKDYAPGVKYAILTVLFMVNSSFLMYTAWMNRIDIELFMQSLSMIAMPLKVSIFL